MILTKEWAESLNVSAEDIGAVEETQGVSYARTARDIALRAIILQGVVAVACEVDPAPVIEWFQEQKIWDAVTPLEKEFLLLPIPSGEQRNRYQAHQEAEWALLWMIGKVEKLGLPTQYCDTRRLVDDIIPALGSDIEPFVRSATLRDSRYLLMEDHRTYNLWCYYWRNRREKKEVPYDLKVTVLYERRYAFEWLDDIQEWDEITCDA